MAERRFYVLRVLAALVISALIYVMIFSFAGWVSYLNYQGVSERNTAVEDYLSKLEIPENVTCSMDVLFSSSDILDELGSNIALLEMRLGKKEPRVLEQKKIYSELEARHFELIKKMNMDCNSSFVTVLFFYSNDENAEQSSEVAGAILSTFKRRNPEGIMIYSFDYNLDSDAINWLEEKYFIDRAPFVLINEKDMILNLENINQLDEYLEG